jgi:hypothetical protein
MTQEKKLQKVFKSPSSGVLCNVAQYIAEVMCLRKAERENKGSLSFKFWNGSHKKQYQSQIVAVNRLIKEFGQDVLLAFINSEKGKRIYSLGYYAPLGFIKDMISEFSRTYKPYKPEPVVIKHIDTVQKPKPSFGGKTSLFAKLKQAEKKNG